MGPMFEHYFGHSGTEANLISGGRSSFDGWKYEPREDTESDVPGEVPSLSHGLSAGNVS